jgi:hypothetical protein
LPKKDDYTTLVDPMSLLAWDEQTFLLKAKPDHLAQMALFKVNTGTECRRFAGYTGTGKLRFRN